MHVWKCSSDGGARVKVRRSENHTEPSSGYHECPSQVLLNVCSCGDLSLWTEVLGVTLRSFPPHAE